MQNKWKFLNPCLVVIASLCCELSPCTIGEKRKHSKKKVNKKRKKPKIDNSLCIIIIIIIIIIIAFKGAIRDFLQSPHSAANRLQHVRSSGPGATVCKSRETHRALITCKCHVTCHLVRRV